MRIFPGPWLLAPTLAGAAALLGVSPARADEPRNTTEPRVMAEPGEVVDVIDALDDGDVFDLNLSLGFDYSNKSARVLRDTVIAQPGFTTGQYTAHTLNVGSYAETAARLTPRVDFGVYKDIALHVSLPIVLSNARSLGQVGGQATNPAALAGAPGEQLFSVPFNGPTRSGLEHIAVGIDFNIFNQARDRTKPTWLLGFEGRFSVGTPMHACNADLKLQCADPSDVNRNGKSDRNDAAAIKGDPALEFEGTFDQGGRTAGITRGTIGLEVHTIMSRRMKYIEPYGGFNALFEFPQSSSDYHLTDFSQTLVNHPPIVGTMLMGMMIHPWENREKFSRLTFDLRVAGTYHSEGRDYSELFDALGSSAARSMRTPQFAAYKGDNAGQSVVDPSKGTTYVTGLTDVSAFGSYRLSGSVSWQVGEFLKFRLGVGYRHDQGHNITADAPCNPTDSTIETAGPCHTTVNGTTTTTGLPNPNYRQTINSVGRRYWVDSSNTFDFFASGTVMF